MTDRLDLKADDTILFTGDSITDAGRLERAYRPFGYGYVHFTANYLLAKYPRLDLGIINTGISGNTVRDLAGRWERDCLDFEPDILSVLIGINDLWRLHTPGREAEGVDTDEYETTYRRLLQQVKERRDCRIILLEPFMFCSDSGNEMLRHLRSYIDVVHRLADEFEAVVVPLQAAVDEEIKAVQSDKWSEDMVHPFVWAHAWISQRWIEATKV